MWCCVLLIGAAVTGAGFWLFQSTKRPPDFYAELKPDRSQVTVARARKFDEKLEELNQQIQSDDLQVHTIRFSQDEINAWLTHSLPEQFPRSVPTEVKELLVHLQPDDSSLVMKIQSSFFSGFATASVDLAMGEQPNLVNIELKRLYSGLLRVPVERFRKRIVTGANRAGLPTVWESDELPATLTIDLNQILKQELVRPATIVDIRTDDAAIEIDYRFGESPS